MSEQRAWCAITVSEIEPEYCRVCDLYDDKLTAVTHVVEIATWYGPWGPIARHAACRRHALEIERAFAFLRAPSNVGRAP